MTEIWRDIPGYEGKYQASDQGSIRALDRVVNGRDGPYIKKGKELSRFFDAGYLWVNLCNGSGKAKKTGVHRLVLMAFKGMPANGMLACHNDGVGTNCALANLRWDTPKSNVADMVIHGTSPRGERSANAILTQDQVKEILKRPESSLKLAKEYGVASSTIRAVRTKQNWKQCIGMTREEADARTERYIADTQRKLGVA